MGNYREETSTEIVSWNLSQGIINEISYLLQHASQYYISGNPPKALYYLQSVRMRISPNLSEEEIKELRKLENEFMISIQKSVTRGFEKTDGQKEAYVNVCAKYTIYNDKVMNALKKYGYLIPPKEDKTIMM